MFSRWQTCFTLVAGLLLCAAQYFIFSYAPVEETMGQVQKIFYVHLPMAWWALISFFVVFVASAAYLKTHSPIWDRMAGAAAEVGVLFAGLALVTGSVWARAAWNTWWTWDPRLTTALIMWFVYAGYLLLRSSGMEASRRRTVSAVVGIIAFLDVPLVFLSARMWRSIHPAVFASQGGGLEPEMWHAVAASLIAWGAMWAALCLARYRMEAVSDGVDALSARVLTTCARESA